MPRGGGGIPSPYSCLFEYLGDWLAHFGLGLVGGIADGDEHYGLFVIGEVEQLLTQQGIEVANPAGAKALLGCCETKVLYGNGYIDITMGLAIGTYPLFIVYKRGDDIHGG